MEYQELVDQIMRYLDKFPLSQRKDRLKSLIHIAETEIENETVGLNFNAQMKAFRNIGGVENEN